MPDEPSLPPKREVAMALIQAAPSVYVHLDPRSEEVVVPAWFKKQPQLVLQVGLEMAVPIPDLDVGDEALSCTLSFSRRPQYCYIPWKAVYGLVDDEGRGMIWPDSVPPEVAAAADGRAQSSKRASERPRLRLATSEESEAEQADEDATSETRDEGGSEPAEAASNPAAGEPGALGEDRADEAEPDRERGAAETARESALDDESEPAGAAGPGSSTEEDSAGGPEGDRGDEPRGETVKGRKLPPYLRVVK